MQSPRNWRKEAFFLSVRPIPLYQRNTVTWLQFQHVISLIPAMCTSQSVPLSGHSATLGFYDSTSEGCRQPERLLCDSYTMCPTCYWNYPGQEWDIYLCHGQILDLAWCSQLSYNGQKFIPKWSKGRIPPPSKLDYGKHSPPPNQTNLGESTSLCGLSIADKCTCCFVPSCTSIQNSPIWRNRCYPLLQLPIYRPAAKARSTLGSIQPYVLPHLLGITQELLPDQNLAWQGLMGGDGEGRGGWDERK